MCEGEEFNRAGEECNYFNQLSFLPIINICFFKLLLHSYSDLHLYYTFINLLNLPSVYMSLSFNYLFKIHK